MLITLPRDVLTTGYTLGPVSVDGEPFCFSLEDPVREEIGPNGYFWEKRMKIPGKTAIPAGHYPVIAWNSPRFGRLLPMICNVPDFSGILMHAGNDAGDTEGCLLLGAKRDLREGRVFDCSAVVAEMTRRVKEAGPGKCWITVTNP